MRRPARPDASTLRSVTPTPRQAAGALAVAAGVVVYLFATQLFPYHTANHDEAVYLQQAATLLDGQLFLHPPVEDVFRPWFFVESDAGLYPKYTPVVAGMFAVGKVLGGYHLALAGVAVATVWLSYAVVTEVFDSSTGLVAAALVLASPLFLVQASVFLPYIPTFCLNLLFAWAYLRADRTGDRRLAALAGGAAGLAFFARPYTAVLFALPFVGHALWRTRTLDRPVVTRNAVTAAVGLVGVAVALAYNARMTGDPLTFPYQAFAPGDGLGFGHREILGYDVDYTVSLALQATAQNLVAYVTRWSVAPPLGVVAALAGVGALARSSGWNARRIALAGPFVSVPLGELYFWGTLNVLGALDDPADGLIHLLGPYYHVGLLLPTAAFGAVGLVATGRRVHGAVAGFDRGNRHVALLALVLSAAVLGGVATNAAAAPLADNAEVTDRYAEAYEPFEDRSFENAVVFLPTPYGEWLNHPFQVLRNGPGFDGDAVYATSTRELAVAGAYPDRTLYRYTYRGVWAPTAGRSVTPHLRRVDRVTDERVTIDLSAGVPAYTELVSIRVSNGERSAAATVTDPGDALDLRLTVSNGTARLSGPRVDGPVRVPLDGRDELDVSLLVDDGTVSTFSYEVGLPVDATGSEMTVLSPRLAVCRSPARCGGEAAYVPGGHRSGVWLNTSLSAAD